MAARAQLAGWRRRTAAAGLAIVGLTIGTVAAAAPAQGDVVPYPVLPALPSSVSSPPVDPRAPFTPTVLALLRHLEPGQGDPEHDTAPAVGTTAAQLTNVARILHGIETSGEGSAAPCTGVSFFFGNVGSVVAPTGTDPAIAPLCWTDAQGVGPGSGAQRQRTTAPPIRLGMASAFDPALANAWGQVEGVEGRQLGMTGIYGPQLDLTRLPDWARNDPTYGEDPFLHGTLGAAEVNGIQGKGLMSQVKHFAFYDGSASQVLDARVQDQAAHQVFLQPYEYGTSGSHVLPKAGQASSVMCSYQRFEIADTPGQASAPLAATGPVGGDFSCDNKALNYVLRDQWNWPGFVASDYRLGMDSTVKAISNGTDQEMPDSIFFGDQLVDDVMARVIPLTTFNRAAARILYQEERFHLLGHKNADSDYLSPSNPSEGTGKYPLTTAQRLNHAALVERAAEESAVLLKNDPAGLPLTSSDLRGLLVLGAPAEYMPASPGNERSTGFPDRDAISPLQQLRQFAPSGAKITFLPGVGSPGVGEGRVVPQAALSTDGLHRGDGVARTGGTGAARTDRTIDFTRFSGNGQLDLGKQYTWSGYLVVPKTDDYTFHVQFSLPDITPAANGCSSGSPTFQLATKEGVGQSMDSQSLAAPSATPSGVATSVTMTGAMERGLASCQVGVQGLTVGVHRFQLTWTAPGSLGADSFHLREPGTTRPSLRFAYSRATGDVEDAVRAARSAKKVLVFADAATGGAGGAVAGSDTVSPLAAATDSLIEAVAAANVRTVVVLSTSAPVLTPWVGHVKGLLQLWWPGQEGGTAAARLLLGLANPSGHLPETWPAAAADTLVRYNQTVPLYPGDTTGTHPERFTGVFSEGVFVGYRFFDREHLKPQFPFGWGLSYTTFRYAGLAVRPSGGGADVSYTVTNTGTRAGDATAQLYLGPANRVPAGVQQADRSLAGFDRLALRPGQSARRTVHVGPGSAGQGHGDVRAFQYWSSPDQRWVTASGCRRVWLGAADAPSALAASGRVGPGTSRAGCFAVDASGSPSSPSAHDRLPATGARDALPSIAAALLLLAAWVRRRIRATSPS